MRANVLIVDDDVTWMRPLERLIGPNYELRYERDVNNIDDILRSSDFRAVITNWDLTPETDPMHNYGVKVIDFVQREYPDISCIVVTGYPHLGQLQEKHPKALFLSKKKVEAQKILEILEQVVGDGETSHSLKIARQLNLDSYQFRCLLRHPLVQEKIGRVEIENGHVDEIEAFEAVFRSSRQEFAPAVLAARRIEIQDNKSHKGILEKRKEELEETLLSLRFKSLSQSEKDKICKTREVLWEINAQLGLFKSEFPQHREPSRPEVKERIMPSMDSDIHRKLVDVLERCEDFSSHKRLCSLFNDNRLALWLPRVPEENNLRDRVESTIDYLYRKSNRRGESALALLLYVLRDKVHHDDERYETFDSLAGQLGPPRDQTVSNLLPQPPKDEETVQMLTWLHISDLHFRIPGIRDSEIVLDHLIKDIENRVNIDPQLAELDFIFVTGDIAFSGKNAEYERCSTFFKRLARVTHVRRDRIFVVPGNHDVSRDCVSPIASKSILTNRGSVDQVYYDPESRIQFMRRFSNYSDFVSRDFKRIKYKDGKPFYTKRRTIKGVSVRVLGLNSAWTSSEDNEYGKLILGSPQIRDALAADSKKADITIALLHHPLDWFVEFDRDECEPQIRESCDFVLHGHMHKTRTSTVSAPGSRIMVVGAGACYMGSDKPNAYNYVKFDPRSRKGSLYLREYTIRSGGHWTTDTRTYKGVDGKYEFELQK